ncbi:formyltransferase [Ferrovum sp. PN-J185]|uniref:formyltransferase n=1 Tax=Ferrovum sp. PN-J185 TaxID=1356306 RepID=UPI00079B7917|nr:formyltransferase [Ferrovum sp. PN-J185]KXW56577.1 bifunctional polymyxin resistance protein ArnA [Ferrovum sp. PN-J185]
MVKAVVFAYHNIGVKALKVLLKHNVDVSLVLTHEDNPNERIWFDSVKVLCQKKGLKVITPDNPNQHKIIKKIKHIKPDFIFSFYYRHMLSEDILKLAKRGAYNLHGSLLPKYRGRVPINWAIIHGESETGATLHVMTKKPDQGDIVAQQAVPIHIDDTAKEVFDRVTDAAVKALDDVLPKLIKGKAPHHKQHLHEGSYFSGRKAEDGQINWSSTSFSIHNLVRAVAPPYPGAFTYVNGQKLTILRTSLKPTNDAIAKTMGADNTPLYILALELDGQPLDGDEFKKRFPKGVRPDC